MIVPSALNSIVARKLNIFCLYIFNDDCLVETRILWHLFWPKKLINITMVTVINNQVVLEEEYDENYEPTEEGIPHIIYHFDNDISVLTVTLTRL